MSLIQELAGENLLYIALQGCRAVLERELGIKQILFSMSADFRQELIRRARETQDLTFPYAYMTLSSLAGERDRQNSWAVKQHGLRFSNMEGQRATTSKGYLFPIALGLDFHYIDSDQKRLLTMAQALVILSAIKGLTFQIDVGNIFSCVVDLEIPQETTINIEDPNAADLPGASDINVQIITHTQIGFFRDVSAVNGSSPTMSIKVNGVDTFTEDIKIL